MLHVNWSTPMKKDKDTNQLITNSDSAHLAKEQISSVALALQLLNKEKDKMKEIQRKEFADESAKVRCRACFKEIAPTRRCFGHGAGGGGESNAGSGNSAEEETILTEDKSLAQSEKVITTIDELSGKLVFMEDADEPNLEFSFAPELIEVLIDHGKLLVDSERDTLTLTIKLLCEHKDLSEDQKEELKKFMKAIIKEFSTFKKENNLSDDCIKIIKDENRVILSLHLNMPTLTLYDSFIQRLASKLVPLTISRVPEKYEALNEQPNIINPFSMKPKFVNKDKSSKQAVDAEVHTAMKNEEQEIFNPSPFDVKPWK